MINRIVSAIIGAKKVLNPIIGGLGQTATNATTEAVKAAGGRKFFYGGWLIPAWILVTFLLKMPEVLILTGAGGIAFAIGWEGFRDVHVNRSKGEAG